jgi:hypothetical protein
MNKNINQIEHAVEVASFSMANTKTVETRKGLYDSIERDLKAIFREVAGFDLNEGYYLKFNKNEDGSWKTDLHVSIDADEAFYRSHLQAKNADLDRWLAIKEVEGLHDKSLIANYPCHLCSVFSIEAEVGDRWSKKTKLSVGCEYGAHHYTTNAQREALRKGDAEDLAPTYRAYSTFKEIKGQYAHNLIKLDKAYKMFKYYVVQFFARLQELNDGYEFAKAYVQPHSEYLSKLRAFEVKHKELNNALFDKFNPNAEPNAYKSERINIGNERIWVRNVQLHSAENIDVTTQILELISKLKFDKPE